MLRRDPLQASHSTTLTAHSPARSPPYPMAETKHYLGESLLQAPKVANTHTIGNPRNTGLSGPFGHGRRARTLARPPTRPSSHTVRPGASGGFAFASPAKGGKCTKSPENHTVVFRGGSEKLYGSPPPTLARPRPSERGWPYYTLTPCWHESANSASGRPRGTNWPSEGREASQPHQTLPTITPTPEDPGRPKLGERQTRALATRGTHTGRARGAGPTIL